MTKPDEWSPTVNQPAALAPGTLRDQRCTVVSVMKGHAVVQMNYWLGEPLVTVPTEALIAPYDHHAIERSR